MARCEAVLAVERVQHTTGCIGKVWSVTFWSNALYQLDW
jgi:hypothetical protein